MEVLHDAARVLAIVCFQSLPTLQMLCVGKALHPGHPSTFWHSCRAWPHSLAGVREESASDGLCGWTHGLKYSLSPAQSFVSQFT